MNVKYQMEVVNTYAKILTVVTIANAKTDFP